MNSLKFLLILGICTTIVNCNLIGCRNGTATDISIFARALGFKNNNNDADSVVDCEQPEVNQQQQNLTAIPEMCKTGKITDENKQNCCPVGQWPDKNGICHKLTK